MAAGSSSDSLPRRANMRILPTVTGMTLAVAASASAQARFELSLPRIMRGVENTGR